MSDRQEPTGALEQELLDLLRAVDPALEVEPSPGFVASVLASVADDDAAAPATGPLELGARLPIAAELGGAPSDLDLADPGDPEEVEDSLAAAASSPPGPLDLDAARRRADAAEPGSVRHRRRTWLAGAAAAVVIGAVGFGAGSLVAGGGLAASGGASDAGVEVILLGSDAAGAIPESAYPPPVELNPMGGGAQEGSAADTSLAAGAQDAAWGWPAFVGHRTYEADLALGTEAGTATLYALDASGVGEGTARQLAAYFGLPGEPKLEWGSWTVGDGESGGWLSVSLEGSASMSYQNWKLEPSQRCWDDSTVWQADGEPEGGWEAYEAKQQECLAEVTAQAPDPAEAAAALDRLLVELGLDTAEYEILALPADPSSGSGVAQASATRIVAGQATNVRFELSLAPEGITSVWGSLADVIPLRDVTVISEREAFGRFSDTRFGGGQGYYPYLGGRAYETEQGTDEYVPPTQAPAAPSAGTPIEWDVQRIVFTSVRLGLAQQYQSDGGVLLVPTYEFTGSGGAAWSMIAVADNDLAFESTE